MKTERVLILLDGEVVVSAFVLKRALAAQNKSPPCERCGCLDGGVQGLKDYAEDSGFALVEVQAPVCRSPGELSEVDSTIFAAFLEREVDLAPRDLDNLRKLSRNEKVFVACGLDDLDGQPQGDALFTAPFESLEDDEMAERLYHKLVAHDAQCVAT